MTGSPARLDYACGPNRTRDGFANVALLPVVVLFGALNVMLYDRQVRSLLRLSGAEVALMGMAAAAAIAGVVYAYHRRTRRNPRPLSTRAVIIFAAFMQLPIVANYAVLTSLDSVLYSAGPPPWLRVVFVAAFLASVWLVACLVLRRRAHRDGGMSYNP